MNGFVLFCLLAFLFACSRSGETVTRHWKSKGVEWSRSKVYGYPEGKKKLAQVDLYKNNYLYERTVYYELWPNYEWKFVSRKGFKTTEKGEYLLNKPGVEVPDNVLFEYFDARYMPKFDVFKDGKRVPLEVGKPDGTEELLFLAPRPGLYVWKEGKMNFKRDIREEELNRRQAFEEKLNQQKDTIP